MFTNQIFIGIGQLGCYFTLRETYQHFGRGEVCNGVFTGEVEVRSFHHFNLSQNPDEAFAKATAFSLENGIPLITTRASLAEELNAISRTSAEQLATEQKALEEKQASWANDLQKRESQKYDLIKDGRFPFGQHEGKTFRESPITYINWVVNGATFEAGTVGYALSIAVKAQCADLILPVASLTKTTGTIGVRQDFVATVTRRAGYSRPAFNRYHDEWVNIITFVTDDGVCLVTKGTSFDASVGDRLVFKATVKGFEEFRGQAQTLIQRITVK